MPKVQTLDAALQYLTWALEEIETFGHDKAALHARTAVEELRKASSSARAKSRPQASTGHHAKEAKHFRDKADEAEQLQRLADTGSKRDALGKIAETYRRTAEQLDELSELVKKVNGET